MIETIVSLAILIMLIVNVIFSIRLMQLMRRYKDNDKEKDNIYVTCIDRWKDCVHHANDSFACQKREIRIKGGECKSYQPRRRDKEE